MADEPPALEYGKSRLRSPFTDHLVFTAFGLGFGVAFLGLLLWWFLIRN